jgi:hypothetical protein
MKKEGTRENWKFQYRILLVPCRPSTPAYKHETKAKDGMCYHVLPCAQWLQTPPPSFGGLRYHHVSCGSGPASLLGGSGAVTCPMAQDPVSLLGRTLVLPHVLWP